MIKYKLTIKGINEGLSKICWGKVRRGEVVIFLLFPLASKHWNLSLATELGSSFTFSLKGWIWII